MNKHISVLLNESIAAFEPVAGTGNTIVDCTLGAAGHTSALLERYPDAKVLACDMDASAIQSARERLKNDVEAKRVDFFHGNFSELVDVEDSKLPEGFASPWRGALLDLGFSSNQLEDPEYGMSFQLEGPLDMRLSRQGQTAWELMLECSDQEFGDILKAYGEIIGAHRLARRIREAILNEEIKNSTAHLADFVAKISGGRKRGKIHPATLVFQALRIAVNDELRVLDHFLSGISSKLSPDGILAVISFHSLEDRIVKHWGIKQEAGFRATTKKPIMAGQEEINANPRARSAKLRVFQKR